MCSYQMERMFNTTRIPGMKSGTWHGGKREQEPGAAAPSPSPQSPFALGIMAVFPQSQDPELLPPRHSGPVPPEPGPGAPTSLAQRLCSPRGSARSPYLCGSALQLGSFPVLPGAGLCGPFVNPQGLPCMPGLDARSLVPRLQ